jgi:hypothetical protein
MPNHTFEFKPGDYPVIHRFFLPYIVQPAGEWEHTYDEQKWKIKIQHQIVPPLLEIATGIKFNKENPVRIDGPREIFMGFTKVEMDQFVPHSTRSEPGMEAEVEIRNLIADIINDLQYRYLMISGKYWWNEVSADHFVNMESVSQRARSTSTLWAVERKLIEWRHDEEILTDFSNYLRQNTKLPVEEIFLTDAKRHYLTGEYHLMYVEATTALELVTERAYRFISNVYERRMFKDGHLAGKVAHLLHFYCKWADNDIDKVVKAIESRNEVIHNQKRKFTSTASYLHLDITIRAVRAIMTWLGTNDKTNIKT